MAERTGLEPATPGVTGRYSNQLNYRSARKPIFLYVAAFATAARSAMNFTEKSVWLIANIVSLDDGLRQWLVGADGIEPPTFAL